MAGRARDGRVHAPELALLASRGDDGRIALRCPGVGLWRGAPALAARLAAGEPAGELEVLGRRFVLRVPDGASGLVVRRAVDDDPRARLPVDYGRLLVELDPRAVGASDHAAATGPEAGGRELDGLVLRAPSSGRFYGRPAPDQPPFVAVGTRLRTGTTVGLLEVMKTFNRITYGGQGLPDEAWVVEVVPREGDDLDAGAVIVRLRADPPPG